MSVEMHRFGGEGVFVREVQRDPAICNNCFRPKVEVGRPEFYRRRELSPRWSSVVTEVWSVNERCAEDVYCFGGHGFACMCGEIDGGKVRPLGWERFWRYGGILLYTLVEWKGVELDEWVFAGVLWGLKRDPDNQFRDDGLFMRAVEAAVSAVESGSE